MMKSRLTVQTPETMNRFATALLFDRTDRMLAAAGGPSARSERDSARDRLPELHPRGILELVEAQPVRIVNAVRRLLDTFETGMEGAEHRVAALRALFDELGEGLDVPLKLNTGRVLIEVAKELLRSGGDPWRQLRLARDLRMALLGNPRFIRLLLRRYRLLEMPEHVTPVTFDYHVHDANTKGRKSPSHLVMDAWIKGIVRLQVIYYDFVPREAAAELLQAAAIVGVQADIGVEFRTGCRGRPIDLIWTPPGCADTADFLKFLGRRRTADFTRKCVEAADFRAAAVYEALRRFNSSGLARLNARYRIRLEPVPPEEFAASVPYGRPAPEHLGEFLAGRVRAALESELEKLAPDDRRRRRIRRHLSTLTAAELNDRFVGEAAPDSGRNPADLPELYRLTPPELIEELRRISPGGGITLNLSGLYLADVLELLYDCRGEITALEIFNLKDFNSGVRRDDVRINALRRALNDGNVVKLKSMVLAELRRLRDEEGSGEIRRRLREILRDLPRFISFYRRSPLRAVLGSDSAGRAGARRHGMGFAVIDTLPRSERRRITAGRASGFSRLEVDCEVCEECSRFFRRRTRWLRPGGFREVRRWMAADLAADIGSGGGNLISLGGFRPSPPPEKMTVPAAGGGEYWRYLNTKVKIALEIVAGYLAAALSFLCSDSSQWWLLTYFGAAIWLGITLVRNLAQSVLAGGGFRRSSFFKWRDYISWQRVADSLFFTGLSVPLLELAVKRGIIAGWLGWNAEAYPLAVYTGIGLANGLYLNGHNWLRALPPQAVWGNWLRVPLAIPLAVGISAAAAGILGVAGMPAAAVATVIQQWAAVISKFASDCIGGVVEARADRMRFLAARLMDVRRKLDDFYELIARLELLTPDRELVSRLAREKPLLSRSGLKRSRLVWLFYANALDMMYIWMRQPQAVNAVRRVMATASDEEKRLFLESQKILCRKKAITRFLVDGGVGRNFRRALIFYLHGYRSYLRGLEAVLRPSVRRGAPGWQGLSALLRTGRE